jgi:type IV pilus biogenesis protein PilP
LETAFELLRQERLVKAYKEHALEEEQKWIQSLRAALEEAATAEASRDEVVEDFKRKLGQLATLSARNFDGARTAKENFEREMSTMQAQVAILRSRLEATEYERTSGASKINPFAASVNHGVHGGQFIETESALEHSRIADLYSIVDIRGQGENVVARLRNKAGQSFTVRIGTVLQTGHTVEEITKTFVRADKGGVRDYIFFSAGGAIEKEPAASQGRAQATLENLIRSRRGGDSAPQVGSGPAVSEGIPSSARGMFVR